jgi:hypothetical protein
LTTEGIWEGWLEFHFLLLKGLLEVRSIYPELVSEPYEKMKACVLRASKDFGDAYSRNLITLIQTDFINK